MDAHGRIGFFAFVLYPENFPDYPEKLESLKIPIICSPQHTLDIDEKTNEYKKCHVHIVAKWKRARADAIVRYLNNNGFSDVHHVEEVGDLRAYVRYLCHLDSPSKAHYCVDDILVFNIDKKKVFGMLYNYEEQLTIALDYCYKVRPVTYASFINYLREFRPELLKIVAQKVQFFNQIIAGMNYNYLSNKGAGLLRQ